MLGAALVAFGSVSSAFAEDGAKMDHKGGDRFFAKMDNDGDGVVSKEEFQSHGDEMFSKMDANGDGKIEKGEAEAAHEKMKEKWKERRAKAQSETKDSGTAE